MLCCCRVRRGLDGDGESNTNARAVDVLLLTRDIDSAAQNRAATRIQAVARGRAVRRHTSGLDAAALAASSQRRTLAAASVSLVGPRLSTIEERNTSRSSSSDNSGRRKSAWRRSFGGVAAAAEESSSKSPGRRSRRVRWLPSFATHREPAQEPPHKAARLEPPAQAAGSGESVGSDEPSVKTKHENERGASASAKEAAAGAPAAAAGSLDAVVVAPPSTKRTRFASLSSASVASVASRTAAELSSTAGSDAAPRHRSNSNVFSELSYCDSEASSGSIAVSRAPSHYSRSGTTPLSRASSGTTPGISSHRASSKSPSSSSSRENVFARLRRPSPKVVRRQRTDFRVKAAQYATGGGRVVDVFMQRSQIGAPFGPPSR